MRNVEIAGGENQLGKKDIGKKVHLRHQLDARQPLVIRGAKKQAELGSHGHNLFRLFGHRSEKGPTPETGGNEGKEPPITPHQENEDSHDDRYAPATAKLQQFLAASEPGSILFEGVRDWLMTKEAEGTVDRITNEYEAYRRERSPDGPTEQDWEFQRQNRQARERMFDLYDERANKQKSKKGKDYLNAWHAFGDIFEDSYLAIATKITPDNNRLENMFAGATVALQDLSRLEHSQEKRQIQYRSLSKEVSRQQFSEQVYSTAITELANNREELESNAWGYSEDNVTGDITHAFIKDVKYFGVSDTKGNDELHSVNIQADVYHQMTNTDNKTPGEFGTDIHRYAKKLEIEESLPDEPDAIIITIKNHVPDTQDVRYRVKKVKKDGKVSYQLHAWEKSGLADYKQLLIMGGARKLLADVMGQLPASTQPTTE